MSSRPGSLKVLLLVPSPPPLGGVEAAYQMLLPHLRVEFEHLAVCSNSVRETNLSRGRFDWAGVKATGRMLIRQWKALAAHRPDVVLTTLSVSATGLMKEGASILLARLWGSRVVVHYHQGEVLATVRAKGSWWLRQWLEFILRQVRFVLVLGEAVGEALTASGISSRKVRVLHNCIDLATVVPKDWARTASGEALRLVFLGDVSVRKGFPDLAEALGIVRERHAVTATVAGEIVPPSAESFLRRDFLPANLHARFDRGAERIQSALAAGTAAGINYVGCVRGSDKWDLLRESDVLVLPSYAEGLPMSILEAMATGLPIVATSVGAVTDAVIDGVTGYVVPPGDVVQLADRIARLASDASLRRRMGEAGRQHIASTFSGPAVGRQLGRLLREAAVRQLEPKPQVS